MKDIKLAQMFLMEIEDMIVELEEGLVSLEKNPLDNELINQVFRAAHTIKGGAGMTGYVKMVDFVHVMEDILDNLRSKKLTITKEMISELLKSIDALKQMKDEIKSQGSIIENELYQNIQNKLKTFLELKPDSKPSTAAQFHIIEKKNYEILLKFNPDALKTSVNPIHLIEDIANAGKIESINADISNLPYFKDIDVHKLYLSWKIILKTSSPLSNIKNIFLFLLDEHPIEIKEIKEEKILEEKRIGEILIEDGAVSPKEIKEALDIQKKLGEILVSNGKITEETLNNALAKQEAHRECANISFIRVDTEKLDKLVNLVGELVTGVSQTSEVSHRIRDKYMTDTNTDELVTSIESLDQISRDIQEQVMLVRMVPVEFTFSRFKRVVRDLADELGKKIILEMFGTETELDKNVIERLSDPLKHLIRNCVDHGIETPSERLKCGKEEAGHIVLKAMQKGESIIIEISDDGKGINRKKIFDAAKKQGLITGDINQVTDHQILNLIFAPGVSTSEKITDISGRGVGMDVVRRNIEELRGTIDISSTEGKGTSITIRLPLTLAIIEGMNVQVGNEILTVPLLSIIEQIRPKKKDIKTVEGKGEVVNVRGTYFPLVRLHELFNFKTEFTDPTKALVLVLESEGKRFCLMVDNVLGEQQAVVKALDKNFVKINGVSGATILGDGRISLILDINRIEKMAFK